MFLNMSSKFIPLLGGSTKTTTDSLKIYHTHGMNMHLSLVDLSALLRLIVTNSPLDFSLATRMTFDDLIYTWKQMY